MYVCRVPHHLLIPIDGRRPGLTYPYVMQISALFASGCFCSAFERALRKPWWICHIKLMLAYHPRSIMGDHPDRNVAYESRFAEKEHRHNWRSVQSAK